MVMQIQLSERFQSHITIFYKEYLKTDKGMEEKG